MNTPIEQEIWQIHAWRNRLQSLMLLGLLFIYAGLLGLLLLGGHGFFAILVFTALALSLNPSVSPGLPDAYFSSSKVSLLPSVLVDSAITKPELKEPPRWHISGLWY